MTLILFQYKVKFYLNLHPLYMLYFTNGKKKKEKINNVKCQFLIKKKLTWNIGVSTLLLIDSKSPIKKKNSR